MSEDGFSARISEIDGVACEARIILVEGVPIFEKDLPDGRLISVQPLIWGYAQLGISLKIGEFHVKGVHADSWQYKTTADALHVFATWDGQSEPSGWVKRGVSSYGLPERDAKEE